MFPSFTVFGKTIASYAVMAVLGTLAAFWLIRFLAKRHGLYSQHVLHTLLATVGGAVLGAMVLYTCTQIPTLIHYWNVFMQHPKLFLSLFGGMVFYGGLIGGILAMLWYLKAHQLDIPAYLDIFAPAVPLFHAFGRVGCFLGGCCYGIEWAGGPVFYNSPAEGANGVPRFPVQLLESFGNLLLCALLVYLCLRKSGKTLRKGSLAAIYLLSYALLRFGTEFLRGDVIRGHFLALSTSQWISLLIAAVVLALLLWQHHRSRKKPLPSVPPPADSSSALS